MWSRWVLKRGSLNRDIWAPTPPPPPFPPSHLAHLGICSVGVLELSSRDGVFLSLTQLLVWILMQNDPWWDLGASALHVPCITSNAPLVSASEADRISKVTIIVHAVHHLTSLSCLSTTSPESISRGYKTVGLPYVAGEAPLTYSPVCWALA